MPRGPGDTDISQQTSRTTELYCLSMLSLFKTVAKVVNLGECHLEKRFPKKEVAREHTDGREKDLFCSMKSKDWK